jgi:hypothetical protein
MNNYSLDRLLKGGCCIQPRNNEQTRILRKLCEEAGINKCSLSFDSWHTPYYYSVPYGYMMCDNVTLPKITFEDLRISYVIPLEDD